MNLWIRSQDKRTLIKIDRIDVDNNSIIVWQNNYNCDEIYMGTYSSKERALEVLDEIQKKIVLLGLSNNFGAPMVDLDNPFNIYKMPKE